MLLLLGGPAGAGKSTLARAWCETRKLAVHIELDAIRDLIVAGLDDPQTNGPRVGDQYRLSVRACCALGRTFHDAGYDVAIDDAVYPNAFESDWRPGLAGLDYSVVIVLPTLETALLRSRMREKRVLEVHSRDQHAASLEWPARDRLDTTGLTVDESLANLREMTGT